MRPGEVDGVDYNTEWVNPLDISAVWGQITGTLANQTDLQTALDGKYDASNPSGYIDSSALSGYATESWVTTQLGSYLTTIDAASTYYPLSNPSGYTTESWVTSQGYLSFDVYGRLTFGNGTNPDPTPIAGRLWFQSEKFRYSTSTAQLNALASEGWCDGKFQTTAGMSSYLTTSEIGRAHV